MISIRDFEIKINENENRIVRYLSRLTKIQMFSLVVTFFGLIHFFFLESLVRAPVKFLHYPNIAAGLKIILLIIVFSIMMPLFKTRRVRALYTIGVTFCVWLFYVWDSLTLQASIMSYIAFPLIMFLAFRSLVSQRKPLKKIFIFMTMFIAILIASRLLAGDWAWLFQRKLNLYFFFVVAFLSFSFNGTNATKSLLTFSPAHLVLPVNFPAPEKDLYERDEYEIWVQGVFNLGKAYLSAIANLYMLKFFTSIGLSSRSNAILVYSSYLLTATAVGNFVTGLVRIYYVKVVDCSNNIWLASSPLDFFKRENVHAYQFSLRFFYFNFLKITRNFGLIVLCYFLIFPLYRNSLDLLTVNHLWMPANLWDSLIVNYLFWISLFVLVASTFKLKFFANPSWRSSILTHGLMMLLFHLVFTSNSFLLTYFSIKRE